MLIKLSCGKISVNKARQELPCCGQQTDDIPVMTPAKNCRLPCYSCRTCAQNLYLKLEQWHLSTLSLSHACWKEQNRTKNKMDGVVCGTAVQLSWFSEQVLQEEHPVLQFVASLWLKQRHKCHSTLPSCQLPVCGWNRHKCHCTLSSCQLPVCG